MCIFPFGRAVECDGEIPFGIACKRAGGDGLIAIGDLVADVGGAEAMARIGLDSAFDLDAVARKVQQAVLGPDEVEGRQHEFVGQHPGGCKRVVFMLDAYGVESAETAFLQDEAAGRRTEFSGGEYGG